MRNKALFIYLHNFNKRVICQRKYFTPTMHQLLLNPEICFEQPLRFFKNKAGDSTTVSLIKVDDHLLVVKRYNVKNFFHGLKLFFRKSRAMYSWINAHHLIELNIPTIEPVAVVENRFGPLRNKAYFIYKYVEGINFFDFFKSQTTFSQQFSQVIKDIAVSMKKLKSAHIYHADLHHKNMLLVDDKILLLDLDHMKKYRFLKNRFHKAHQKDINQFVKYLKVNAEAKKFFLQEMEVNSEEKES